MKTRMAKAEDGRRLAPKAQEALRRRVVDAILNQGMRQTEAARVFGVSRTSVYNWQKASR